MTPGSQKAWTAPSVRVPTIGEGACEFVEFVEFDAKGHARRRAKILRYELIW